MSATQTIPQTENLMMEPKQLKGVITLDELESTSEWQGLTGKQRDWVTAFIKSNGNRLVATHASYNCRNNQHASILSHQIPESPRVRAVLDLFLGKSEYESFVDKLKRKIAKGRNLTIAEVKALELLCRLKHWDRPDFVPHLNGYSAKGEKFTVGQIIEVDGKSMRVTAVDENGVPVEGEEL